MTRLLRIGAFVAALLLAGGVRAQDAATYPNHQVKVIVPFAAGGPSDVIARLLAQKLFERLGQRFYVENHAGAGGNLGIAMAAREPADGYSLVVVSSSFVVNPSLYAKVPYNPYKDFAPVTLAAASPNVLVVHPSVPARSVKELIELVRANPGKYVYAMPGAGTTPHLGGELFKLSLKLDMVTIPFGGAGPAIQSTTAGHTPIAFTALPPAAPMVQAGQLRALAVTSAKRSAALPDVPTMAEAGVPGQEADTLQGVLVPGGTPPAVIAKLNAEIVKIMALPEVRKQLDQLGFEPVADTPAEFAARIKQEVVRWAKVIDDAHIEKQ
jgi:tripartite-type tricarboxylate transporter receptor subunit TctC